MSWLLFVIFSVITGSAANIYQKMTMREEKSDAEASAIAFQWLTGTCYAIFALVSGFHIPPLWLAPYLLASSTLYAAATICLFRAIKLIEASEMSILNGIGPIFTIMISVVFLKDVFTTTQLIGVSCVLIAVTLINFKKGAVVIHKGTWLALLTALLFSIAVTVDTVVIRAFDAVSFIPIGAAGTALILMTCYPRKIQPAIDMITHVKKDLIIYSIFYAASAITFYLAIQAGGLVGQVSTIFRA
jgi:uncharacterized membrane protein